MIFYPVEYTIIYDIQWNDVLESTIVLLHFYWCLSLSSPAQRNFRKQTLQRLKAKDLHSLACSSRFPPSKVCAEWPSAAGPGCRRTGAPLYPGPRLSQRKLMVKRRLSKTFVRYCVENSGNKERKEMGRRGEWHEATTWAAVPSGCPSGQPGWLTRVASHSGQPN